MTEMEYSDLHHDCEGPPRHDGTRQAPGAVAPPPHHCFAMVVPGGENIRARKVEEFCMSVTGRVRRVQMREEAPGIVALDGRRDG